MTKAIHIRHQSPVLRLYCVNDTHVGAHSALEREQEKLARLIADDPDGYVLGIGDYRKG